MKILPQIIKFDLKNCISSSSALLNEEKGGGEMMKYTK